ncbi:MAG: phosphonate C-P lyase system protein PhnH [Alphaproteobacteria bacterium]
MTTLSTMERGFTDPVLDAQKTFRRLMEAWARPGTTARFDGPDELPLGLDAAGAAIALTLIDQDAPVWLSAACHSAGDWLRLHCASPIAPDPMAAAFALTTSSEMPPLTAFPSGTALSPEAGATLIIRVPALVGGPTVRLTGPGIGDTASIAPDGLPADFWCSRAACAPLYPAGLDIIMTCGSEALCLPRTTTTMEA